MLIPGKALERLLTGKHGLDVIRKPLSRQLHRGRSEFFQDSSGQWHVLNWIARS